MGDKADQIRALREARFANRLGRALAVPTGSPDDQRRAWVAGMTTKAATLPALKAAVAAVSPEKRKRGRPKKLVKDEPWVAAGMSRRTWYRKKK